MSQFFSPSCFKLEQYNTNYQNFYPPYIAFYSQMWVGEWNFTPLAANNRVRTYVHAI